MVDDAGTARRRLLDAAGELLRAARTPDEVSTRAVCDAAGVRAPTLYHHFGDKDGLLEAVLAEEFDRHVAHKRLVEATGDAVEDFRRGWRTHVEFGLDHPALFLLVYGRPGRDGGRTATATAAREHLLALIRRIDDTGRLLPPVTLAADLAASSAAGVVVWLAPDHGTADEPVVDLVLERTMASLVGPPRAWSGDPAPDGLGDAAAALARLLPRGPVAGLRTSETALLHDWLEILATDRKGHRP